ncbi:MAG: 50S ribosomal protein L20 [Phycisphaerales bacterium]|nr:50S ribosomal protein L20 [Phycisphaerales bacterium]
MPRVRPGAATRHRRKRILKDARGYWGSRSKLFRIAKQFVMKAGCYAFRDRRAKKRNFRSLWVTRITAACRMRGVAYSDFIGALRKSMVALNRKMLSEIAIADPAAFDALVALARPRLRRTG